MILFIDTETTGLPNGYSGLQDQPYVVQIAAILCDDSRRPVAKVNRIVRPEGWTIPLEATAIHGLTTKECQHSGIPLRVALQELLSLWSQANQIIAYNVSFDHRMLQLSAERAGMQLPPREQYCAMREASKLISDSGRWMKLGVAYRCFFGRDFENKHDALADVRACMEIYFALQDTLAPVTRMMGDVRGISAAKLQRLAAGAKEVEEHQALLNSLIQLHCNPLKSIDWVSIATQRMPQPPAYSPTEETAATERLKSYRPNIFARLMEFDRDRITNLEAEVEQARARDRQRHEEEMTMHRATVAAMEQRRRTAQKVLAGHLDAYSEIMDFCDMCASPLLARSIIYSFVNSTSVETYVYLNGQEVIPENTKKLLVSGRVSAKKAGKKESLDLFQDHICSAALRVARDFMALLPIKTILFHGYLPGIDAATGQPCDRCVLSCVLRRGAFEKIDFDRVDSADCVKSFPHAMKVSKGQFQEMTLLSLSDLSEES